MPAGQEMDWPCWGPVPQACSPGLPCPPHPCDGAQLHQRALRQWGNQTAAVQGGQAEVTLNRVAPVCPPLGGWVLRGFGNTASAAICQPQRGAPPQLPGEKKMLPCGTCGWRWGRCWGYWVCRQQRDCDWFHPHCSAHHHYWKLAPTPQRGNSGGRASWKWVASESPPATMGSPCVLYCCCCCCCCCWMGFPQPHCCCCGGIPSFLIQTHASNSS